MKSYSRILTLKRVSSDRTRLFFNGKPSRVAMYGSSLNEHERNTLYLLSIETPKALSNIFAISHLEFEGIINNPTYKYFKIAKKNGGYRDIYAPAEKLKKVQKWLNFLLQAYYLSIKPKEIHGFVINPKYLGKHCNIAANAETHTGKMSVLNIDLKDFFPSITAKRVKALFSSDYFNYSEQVATALTFLTTYNGQLPIGAPTSPVISNFICAKLDADLIDFCYMNQLAYTRYADDLTFSSFNKITLDELLNIIDIIKKNHFTINQKKLRIQSKNRKQTVTGLTVNQKVNVDRKMLKKIRAMLHDFSENGIDAAVRKHYGFVGTVDEVMKTRFINSLRGYIDFIGQIKGKSDILYKKYKSSLESACFVQNIYRCSMQH